MGKLQDNIQALIDREYGRGLDGAKIATRLIEAGLTMMAEEGDLVAHHRVVPYFDRNDDFTGFALSTFTEAERAAADAPTYASGWLYVGPGEPNIPVERLPAMVAALRFAGETFDFYARNHIAKGPGHEEKAQRNVEAATRMNNALNTAYAPPEIDLPREIKGADDWKAAVQAAPEPQESESAVVAAGSATALIRGLLASEATGEPMLGVAVHLDDQPVLSVLVELGLVTRDDVSDRVVVSTKGREAIGLRPAGLPDLPVEVADVTGNIEERELAARYMEAKVAGCERLVRESSGDPDALRYLAFVLTEIAHEFRIGLHLPGQVIHGRVIPYNDDRDTGVRHADGLRAFFEDTHARNVKAGWWSDITTGEPKKRSVGELFVLFVTEIAEAYEAWEAQSPDDKLPHLPGLSVELADLGIRWADFCGAALAGRIVMDSGVWNPGAKMFRDIVEVAKQYEAIRKTPEAIGAVEEGEFLQPMDVAAAVDEKLLYNSTRRDHSIAERLKVDGKKT